MKQATLHIDLDSVLYNFRHLKCFYKKKVIAVLKDDAYGLGLLKIYNAIKYEEDLVIAVSSLNEAKLLRDNAFLGPIIYLNVFDKEDVGFIKEDMPVYPGTEKPKLTVANTYENDLFKGHSRESVLVFPIQEYRLGKKRMSCTKSSDRLISVANIQCCQFSSPSSNGASCL